jgi:serine protease Do
VAVSGLTLYDLGSDTGVLVVETIRGSPAARAGVQAGDVIVRLDDSEIATVEDVFAELRDHKPGEKVTLGIKRAGESEEIEVTLGDVSEQ